MAPPHGLTRFSERNFSPPHLHCYWLLTHSANLQAIERGNRKLAHALGADMQCTDSARVLRPPWSRNWKHNPPVPLSIARCRSDSRYRITDVVGGLEDPPPRRDRARVAPRAPSPAGADSLLDVEPAAYVEALTGIAVPAHGKIPCLFHEDRTPSLHVYREPERGWYCFGCGRGGGIYEFAAQVWHMSRRGKQFLELRGRLIAVFSAQHSVGHDWP